MRQKWHSKRRATVNCSQLKSWNNMMLFFAFFMSWWFWTCPCKRKLGPACRHGVMRHQTLANSQNKCLPHILVGGSVHFQKSRTWFQLSLFSFFIKRLNDGFECRMIDGQMTDALRVQPFFLVFLDLRITLHNSTNMLYTPKVFNGRFTYWARRS